MLLPEGVFCNKSYISFILPRDRKEYRSAITGVPAEIFVDPMLPPVCAAAPEVINEF